MRINENLAFPTGRKGQGMIMTALLHHTVASETCRVLSWDMGETSFNLSFDET